MIAKTLTVPVMGNVRDIDAALTAKDMKSNRAACATCQCCHRHHTDLTDEEDDIPDELCHQCYISSTSKHFILATACAAENRN